EQARLAASLDDRARMESRRRVSRARMEAAALRREARERVYTQARAGLRERLETVRSSAHYREILSDLYEEAIAVLPAAEAVRVDPADLELIRAIISEHAGSPRVEGVEMPLGGLTLVAEKQTVDNTMASRLERADGYLRDVAGTVVPGLRGEARRGDASTASDACWRCAPAPSSRGTSTRGWRRGRSSGCWPCWRTRPTPPRWRRHWCGPAGFGASTRRSGPTWSAPWER